MAMLWRILVLSCLVFPFLMFLGGYYKQKDVCLLIPLLLFGAIFTISPISPRFTLSTENVISSDYLGLALACNDSQTHCRDVFLARTMIVGSTPQAITKAFNAETSGTNIDTICFDSPGGQNPASFSIMDFVIKNGLNTCLADRYYRISDNGNKTLLKSGTSYCVSACPFLVMSGENRYQLGNNQRIGMHQSGGNFPFPFGILKLTGGWVMGHVFRREDGYRGSGFINALGGQDKLTEPQKRLVDFSLEYDFQELGYLGESEKDDLFSERFKSVSQ